MRKLLIALFLSLALSVPVMAEEGEERLMKSLPR